MTEKEFLFEQQAAIERMKQMNKKSMEHTKKESHKMPPVPSFVKMPENNQNETPKNTSHIPEPPKPQKTQNSNSSFGIPMLDGLFKDSDSALIIGLLLILFSEKSDKLLLFALIYILI
ncbi:MAG: hypothetical protein IJP34_01445 [Clostridia bacterium]|nr:hypothetical protein [Clostridia bacterium]